MLTLFRWPVRLLLALVTFVPALLAASNWRPPTGDALARLERALAPMDANYDPKEQMLRRPFSSPGYHTELKSGFVHPTRDTFTYALGLLDTGKPERLERAVAVLRRVIGLQDANPASARFGIWSWYLEEPLATMKQPDFNWADFNGVTLLQIDRDHRERLPADLAAEVRAAILRACAAIKKRNVGPGYTNIAIMGAYVTLVAGEQLGVEEYRDYGLARLRRFHDHTLENGAFEEYNSPAYTVIAVQELSRLQAHVQTPAARELIAPMLRKAWEEVATHFHAPTRQWAGPNSRAYSSLVKPAALVVIQRASGGALNLGVDVAELDELRLPLACPPDLVPLFRELTSPRTVTEPFIKRSDTVGTTYLHPQFALGSINHGDLWNQRRALLLHFGTVQRPGYLHLRFLKDGYDFASAQLIAAQQAGTVLGAVNLVTDGGDTHIVLNKVKDGRIRASDLRLRFELGGPAGLATRFKAADLGQPIPIKLDGLDVSVTVLKASLGGQTATTEVTRDDTTVSLDVVLYHGAEKEFDLRALSDAIVGFVLAVGPSPAVQSETRDGRLFLKAPGLAVDAAIRPAPRQWDDSWHAPLGSNGGYR
jgi:hypothetical protein